MLFRFTLSVVLLCCTMIAQASPKRGSLPTVSDYYFNASAPVCNFSIVGAIDESIEHLPQQMLQNCNVKGQEVNISINSPGGYVFLALMLIDAIDTLEANGAKVTCTVTRQAASAGWLVFNACNVRKAHDTAFFMWHSVLVGLMGAYNIPDLTQVLTSMQALQIWFNKLLQTNLMLDDKLFTHLWMTQTTLNAVELSKLSPGYLEIVEGN